MTDVHARIHAFLQQLPVSPLNTEAALQPDGFYNKAGVIPYVTSHPRRFLVMKPVPKHAHLPPPSFQLCKGTRMQRLATGWQDLRDNEAIVATPETLAATALREGIEELGLSLEGIESLHDMGPYAFASSKSATPRHMWLFAAKLTHENALLPEAEVADTTAERGWMTLADFQQVGRDDHRRILADINKKLGAA